VAATDFSAYTKSGTPTGALTVEDPATDVTLDQVARDATVTIREDYGADYLPGDFSHNFEYTMGVGSAGTADFGSLMWNTVAELPNAANASFRGWSVNFREYNKFIYSYYKGVLENLAVANDGQKYYYTLSRTGSDATLIAYSDSERTTIEDSLTHSGIAVDSFRYHSFGAWGNGGSANKHDGLLEDYDMAPAPPASSFVPKGGRHMAILLN
jgi:hypothetical protein